MIPPCNLLFVGWLVFFLEGSIIIIVFATVTLPRSLPRTRLPTGTTYRVIVPSSDNVIDKIDGPKEQEVLHREHDNGDGNSVLWVLSCLGRE